MAQASDPAVHEDNPPPNINLNPWPPSNSPLFEELVRKMRPSILLDSMYAKQLLNREDCVFLKSLPTEEEKSRKLLRDMLPLVSPQNEAFEKFLSALREREEQAELVVRLTGTGGVTHPPQQAKRATIFICTRDQTRLDWARGKLISMFCTAFSMPKETVLLYREEPSGDHHDSMPLVLTDSFPVTIVLHGITLAEFEAGIKDNFIDCIAAWFGKGHQRYRF